MICEIRSEFKKGQQNDIIDIVLVSLLLTLNRFTYGSGFFIITFGQLNSAQGRSCRVFIVICLIFFCIYFRS